MVAKFTMSGVDDRVRNERKSNSGNRLVYVLDPHRRAAKRLNVGDENQRRGDKVEFIANTIILNVLTARCGCHG